MKVAVYTANFGNYDQVWEPVKQNFACDFILFTDNRDIDPCTMWNLSSLRVGGSNEYYKHPRMVARKLKILSHEFMSSYDYTIWIDSGMEITSSNFVYEMLESLNTKNNYRMACIQHWLGRKDLYDEIEACYRECPAKIKGLPLREQGEFYKSMGYSGRDVYATTTVVRDNRDENVARVNRLWWDQICKWTWRDQVSLPYVLWILNYQIGTIPYEKWVSLFNMKPHNSND